MDKTKKKKVEYLQVRVKVRIGLIRFVYFQFFQGVLSGRVILGLAHTVKVLGHDVRLRLPLCGKGILPTNSIYHPSPDPQITTCLKICLSLQVLLKKENGSKANQSYLYYSRCAPFRSRFDK